MIKPHIKFLKKCLFCSDITITIILFPIAVSLQNKLAFAFNIGFIKFFVSYIDWNLLNYSSILIWLIPIWFFALSSSNAYDSFRSKYILDTFYTIIHAAVIVAFFSSILFGFKGFKILILDTFHLGYSFVLIYPALCIIALIASRIFLIAIFRIVRRFGYNQRQMVIVGTGPRGIKHYKKIVKHPEWGFHIIGFITLEKKDILHKELKKFSILGTIDQMESILDKYPVDEVFYVVPRKWLDKIEKSVMICDMFGVTTHIATDLFSIKVSKSTISHFHGLPVLSFNSISTNYSALAFKRTIDILVSTLGIILLLPIFIIIIILIKFESCGPIFFVQNRCGLNGRIFKIYKFRTMVENAEQLKHHLLYKNEQTGPVFKIKTDPRVTRLGKFLRKYSIDEIPQLFNILMGDMSLVGPRPPIPNEVKKYKPWQRRRLSMRPGLTCIWQVSGRNAIKFERWMELDLNYIDNWSLMLDFKLLLKTIPSVLLAKGSH
ncbi:hypothetical protein BVX93_01500 [bacterium B13(2017)]|nr:hypothetical protein BVX93_01500 [bacterium B13(2017)]